MAAGDKVPTHHELLAYELDPTTNNNVRKVQAVTLVTPLGVSSSAAPPDIGVPGVVVADSIWHASHLPAVNVAATASKAAPGAGKRLVITWATFSLAADTVAPAAASTYTYIQGIAGGQMWRSRIALTAVAGSLVTVRFNGVIVIGDNDSASCGMLVAGGANTFQTAAFGGYAVNVT